MKKATAMFGGSFDPIHLGHLHLIHSVYAATRYKRVILVPVAINSFKRDLKPNSSFDRLEMLKLSIDDYHTLYPQDKDLEIIIDSCEIDRGGISYTYDTVLSIYEKYNLDGNLGLLMGDDLISSLDKWYKADQLFKIVNLVVCKREKTEVKPSLDIPIQFITNDIFEDASSTIRSLIKENKDFSSFLSKGVLEYVQRHNLYRT